MSDENNVNNVTSIGQTGGITAHKVTVESPIARRDRNSDATLRWTRLGVLVAAVAAFIAVMAWLYPKGESMGNVTSYNQSGGITAHTVNIGPQRLVFTSEIETELLQKMSSKKPVSLKTVGSNLDQQVGDQIQIFLANNGYNVSRTMIGMMVPPPDGKITLRDGPAEYELIVAPSAN